MTTTQDFKEALRRQLTFLQRSSDIYDAGHTDEAIRMATTLRIIFHDTTKSISLLKHLEAENVLVRSHGPAEQEPPALGHKRIVVMGWSLAALTFDGKGNVAFVPSIRPGVKFKMMPSINWWNEAFAHTQGIEFTRRKVILWAANKDGGTHVDAELPVEYAGLKAPGAMGHVSLGTGTTIPIEDAHYTFLRTMAYEVLNSPDLVALSD